MKADDHARCSFCNSLATTGAFCAMCDAFVCWTHEQDGDKAHECAIAWQDDDADAHVGNLTSLGFF